MKQCSLLLQLQQDPVGFSMLDHHHLAAKRAYQLLQWLLINQIPIGPVLLRKSFYDGRHMALYWDI